MLPVPVWIRAALSALTLTCVTSIAAAQDEDYRAPPPPDISPDFLDPEARTRFHLTTRWTPAPNAALWSFELSGAIRVSNHVALTFTAPFGLQIPHRDAPFLLQEGFFSNLSAGAAGGTAIRLGSNSGARLTLGGALDVYAPTSPAEAYSGFGAGARARGEPYRFLAAARPLHPGLWALETVSGRVRVHGGISVSILDIDAELGLMPGVILDGGGAFVMHFGAGLRARVTPVSFLEPYLELYGTTRIAGAMAVDDYQVLNGAALFTPGIRFHFLGVSPAIFTHIQIGEGDVPETFTLGIDLAGADPDRPREDDPGLDF